MEGLEQFELAEYEKGKKVRSNTDEDRNQEQRRNRFREQENLEVRDNNDIRVHEIPNERDVGIRVCESEFKDAHTAIPDHERLDQCDCKPSPECPLVEIPIQQA